jgi:hypothetical protein
VAWHQFTWLWDSKIGLGEGCRHEKFRHDGYGRVMIGNRCIISAHIPIATHIRFSNHFRDAHNQKENVSIKN